MANKFKNIQSDESNNVTLQNHLTLQSGNIYGKSVNNEYSLLYRFGGLFLTWDSDSYGTNFNHSITSTDNGTYSDSITINSYDKVRINIDTNNNDSNSTFTVGKHGTGSSGYLLHLDESGHNTVTGSSRAPIFYDSDDTNYYLNPASTSNLSRTDIHNVWIGNAIYFGGGNNYLNWTNSRIYSNVGIESADSMRVGEAVLGEHAVHTGYYGLWNTEAIVTTTQQYMIISAGTDTFINGDNVYIRAGNNSTTNQVKLSTSGGLTVGGNRVLTVADEGSGNGLDADTLDGQQNTKFFRSLTGGTGSSIDTYTDNGFRTLSYTGYSSILWSNNQGGSTGTVQLEFEYNTPARGFKVRNKTDNSTWSNVGWVAMTTSNQGHISGTLLHTGNYSSWNRDDRYYTETESDARFLRGDTSDAMAGRLTLHTGGTNTYGLIAGYGNDNHFITMRGKVTTGTGTLTVTGGHQMTFVEHADAADEGWYYVSKASGNYTEIGRLDGLGNMIVTGSHRAPIFYDSNDTTYYTNPAGTSNLYGLTVNQTISGEINDSLRLVREDNRTISPSELSTGRLKFGFTSFGNNNTSPYADFIHMRSYTDASGGHDNLLMFKKAATSKVRLYTQSFGSSTAYSSYMDLLDTSGDDQVKTGYIQSNDSLRAPIFYDSNSTTYYVNPADRSYLAELFIPPVTSATSGATIRTYAWSDSNWGFSTLADNPNYHVRVHGYGTGGTNRQFQVINAASSNAVQFAVNFDGSGTAIGAAGTESSYELTVHGHAHMKNNDINYVNQLHFNDNVRFYDDGNDSYLRYVSGDSNTTGIKFYSNAGNAFRGYVYGDSGGFGLLDNDGNWSVRIPLGGSGLELRSNNNIEFTVNDDHTLSHGSSRAPIFYDSDDTSYYVNPAGTTNINTLVSVDANASTLTASVGVKSPNQGTNYVAHRWAAGNTFPQASAFDGSFQVNGTSSENTIEYGETPFGDRGLIWVAENNDASSNADGGWAKNISNLSDDKAYISICYVKRASSSTNGSFYHGCHGSHTLNLDGTANTNPYFTSFGISNLPQDVWCVSIGIIQANNDSNTAQSVWKARSGVYRLDTGQRIIDVTSFKMKDGSTSQSHRTYLYYSTDSNAELHWYNPGFYEINGQEPSLGEILGDGNTERSRMRGMAFGIPGNGSNNKGRFFAIEGNTDAGGEGSGRIFFSEHNSSTAAMDKYGMSLGYRGGATSIKTTAGNDWTGLSNIGNGEWGLWGHNNSLAGSVAMYGPRSGDYVIAPGSFRAPIFYDSNDTGYYVNPASSSQFSAIYYNEWIRNNRSTSSGLYWESNSPGAGWHIYPSNTSYMYMRSGASSAGGLRLNTAGTDRGYVYWNNANQVGFLSNAAGWTLKVDNSGNTYATASHRAPIFYDTDDTTYFTDPASRSLLNNLDANHFGINNSSSTTKDGISLYGGYSTGEPTYGILFTGTAGLGTYGSVTSDWATYFTMNNNDARGWIFRKVGAGNTSSISAGGVATFGSSTQSPIFYDSVDTNYYVDPANTGTAVYVKGDVVAYGASDERLKDNIKPIDNALDKVCSLSGNTFEWNEVSHRPTGKKDIGVIAQEVEKVFPEIVDTRDSGYKAVYYEKLTAILIEAVKELKEEVKELKDKCNGCTK